MTNDTLSILKASSKFLLESFSKREALLWLQRHASSKECYISIRSLAYIWKWHKSKVERFIKLLKDESLIETGIKNGKTLIKLNLCVDDDLVYGEVKTENNPEYPLEIGKDTIQDQNINEHVKSFSNETDSRQSQGHNIPLPKTKKEKKQKKKTKTIKEKNTPVGSIKKEKTALKICEVDAVSSDSVFEFAMSLGITQAELDWELEKFKDHWLSISKKHPKNGVAAFRNWLRKSTEFKQQRFSYGKISNKKSEESSFKNFLTAGARAIAEFEESGLDRNASRKRSLLFKSNSDHSKKLTDIRSIN